jgi:hypothetical protein
VSGLVLCSGARDGVIAEVERYGALACETGGFLLTTAGTPERLAIAALADERGIDRRRGLFEVSGRAIERLFAWAGERELAIRAQVHSHGRRAFLSRTDVEHGFTVEGFTTAVVPWFAAPPADPARWGWWRCAGGDWLTADAPAVIEAAAEIVHFDEDGVRAG